MFVCFYLACSRWICAPLHFRSPRQLVFTIILLASNCYFPLSWLRSRHNPNIQAHLDPTLGNLKVQASLRNTTYSFSTPGAVRGSRGDVPAPPHMSV